MNQIEKWLQKGLINEELAKILSEDLKTENEKKRKIATQIVIYTIGVILLGIGVISFVAGNDWILELLEKTPLLQVFVLFFFALLSLYLGWELGYNKKNFPRLGGALVFLSTILIGTVYIQMGQTYNWNTNASSVLTLWLLSIFPVAFIFNSKPVNWICIILFLITFPYYYYEWQYDSGEVWTIFMPFSLFGILYTFANIPAVSKKFSSFALSYKMTALVPAFFTFLILVFTAEESYQMLNWHYLAVPAVIIGINLWNYFADKSPLKKHETIFITALMVFILSLLVLKTVNPAVIMFFAHVFIIWIIAEGLKWGYEFENVSLINMNNFFLLIYLLCVYCRYGWNFLDKTLFFLLGGIGLLALGILLEKGKRKKLLKVKEEE